MTSLKSSNNFKLINFNSFGDENGYLTVIEKGIDCPFEIKRVYYIFNTKIGIERGFHAHINLKQIAICVKGSCHFILDDGTKKQKIKLNNPNQGLFIEGLVWREIKDFSSDCVLVVLASELYYEKDYIRDYQSFLKEVKNEYIRNK